MADITQNLVIQPTNLGISPNVASITFTPEPIQLNVFTQSAPQAGNSTQGQLLYNNNNFITGATNTSVSGGNVSFTNIGNIKIAGGANSYFLQTDGTGNLTWAQGTANVSGNGTAAGANTQIQISDGTGNFTSGAGFTFDNASNILTVPGNIISTGVISTSGNVIGSNVIGNLYGDGYNISNINGSNITTYVANATHANIADAANVAYNVSASNISGQVANALVAGTVYTNAQPNITSVGTLVSLNVSGNIGTTGTTSIQQAKEKVTVNASGATGTINYDLLTQALLYYSGNSSSNQTINFRGNSTVALDTVMNSNECMTCSYIVNNGANLYYPNNFQIDGSNISVKWVYPPGAPAGALVLNTNIYTFNIIKTASNTYTVFGSITGYQ